MILNVDLIEMFELYNSCVFVLCILNLFLLQG